jgi:hypothetical protein
VSSLLCGVYLLVGVAVYCSLLFLLVDVGRCVVSLLMGVAV